MDGLFNNKFRIDSARLSTWDYGSNGLYFITICTDHMLPYFGSVEKAGVIYSKIGNYACHCWESIPLHFPFVQLDQYIVMPNHIHGILCIQKQSCRSWHPNQFGPQSKNIASIIRGFKSAVKTYANQHGIDFHWQTRYYDRIIKNEGQLDRVRNYISNNPRKWLAEHGHGQKHML